MSIEGHLNLTGQNFPIENEHEMGDVAEDEHPQRPGPLSRVDAQFRVRGLEKLLYTVWYFTRGLSLSTIIWVSGLPPLFIGLSA